MKTSSLNAIICFCQRHPFIEGLTREIVSVQVEVRPGVMVNKIKYAPDCIRAYFELSQEDAKYVTGRLNSWLFSDEWKSSRPENTVLAVSRNIQRSSVMTDWRSLQEKTNRKAEDVWPAIDLLETEYAALPYREWCAEFAKPVITLDTLKEAGIKTKNMVEV